MNSEFEVGQEVTYGKPEPGWRGTQYTPHKAKVTGFTPKRVQIMIIEKSGGVRWATVDPKHLSDRKAI